MSSAVLRCSVFLFVVESEWGVLLDLIRETASVCPDAFLTATHHSGSVPSKRHGEGLCLLIISLVS